MTNKQKMVLLWILGIVMIVVAIYVIASYAFAAGLIIGAASVTGSLLGSGVF